MDPVDDIAVEVVYARPDMQELRRLAVPPGTTVGEAVRLSALPAQFPELDIERDGVGVFGQRVDSSTILKRGDRVEIYRPLVVDPKQARRARARIRAAGGKSRG